MFGPDDYYFKRNKEGETLVRKWVESMQWTARGESKQREYTIEDMKNLHVNTSLPYPTDKVTGEEVKRLPEGHIGTLVRHSLKDTLFHMGETILTRGFDESYCIMHKNFWIRKGGRCPVEELVEEGKYYQAILNKIYEVCYYHRKEWMDTYEALKKDGHGDYDLAKDYLSRLKSPWNGISQFQWGFVERDYSRTIEVVLREEETNKDD